MAVLPFPYYTSKFEGVTYFKVNFHVVSSKAMNENAHKYNIGTVEP
jgi:hypothetical protein